MSSTVKVTGNIRKMVFPSEESKEIWAKAIVQTREESCSPYETYTDKLLDDIEYYTEDYCILNGSVYQILTLTEDRDPDYNYCNITMDESSGSIQFDTMFYNGGTCWEEMVGDKLNQYEKEEEDLASLVDDFAVFAYSQCSMGEAIEQLTHWDTLEGAKRSKEGWFQKERYTFILARFAPNT